MSLESLSTEPLVFTPELVIRVVFFGLLVALACIRVYFHSKSGTLKESPFSAAEGTVLSVVRFIAGLTCVGSLLLALIAPDLLRTTSVALPVAIRVSGVALFAACLLGLIWVHNVLGRNFSPTLHVREGNHLVEEGPYKWVRHPMYTVMVGCVAAMILVTGNGVVAVSAIATMGVVILFRTPKEEAMMIAEFGDRYRAYRHRTGAIFPRILGRTSPGH